MNPMGTPGSEAAHQLCQRDAEALGELPSRREPDVEIAPLDLLVVRERDVEVPHHVELRQLAPSAKRSAALSEADLEVVGSHPRRWLTLRAYVTS